MNATVATTCTILHAHNDDVITIIDVALILLIILTATFENLIILVIIFRTRSVHSPTNIFIGCLSLADLSIVLFSLPMILVIYAGPWKPTINFFAVYNVFESAANLTSVSTLTALACDRYFIVVHPYKYERYMTVKAATVVSLLICVYSVTMGMLPHIMNERTFIIVKMVAIYFLPSTIMMTCHIQVAMVAQRHAKDILKLQIYHGNEQADERQNKILRNKYSMLRKMSKVKIEPINNVNNNASSVKSNVTIETELEFDLSSSDEHNDKESKISKSSLQSSSGVSSLTSDCTENKPSAEKTKNSVSSDVSSTNDSVQNIEGQANILFLDTTLSSNQRTIRISMSVAQHNQRNKQVSHVFSPHDSAKAKSNDVLMKKGFNTSLTPKTITKQKRDWPETINYNKIQSTPKTSPASRKLKKSLSLTACDTKQIPKKSLRSTKSEDSITLKNVQIKSPVLPTASGGNFRNLVQRNIQANRKRKFIHSETLKIVKQLRRLRQELKATLLLTLVMGLFLCLWTPFVTINIMYVCSKFSPCTNRSQMLLLKYFKLLHYINSAVNPVFYVLLNSKLKRECMTVLKSIKRGLTLNSRRIKPLTS